MTARRGARAGEIPYHVVAVAQRPSLNYRNLFAIKGASHA